MKCIKTHEELFQNYWEACKNDKFISVNFLIFECQKHTTCKEKCLVGPYTACCMSNILIALGVKDKDFENYI